MDESMKTRLQRIDEYMFETLTRIYTLEKYIELMSEKCRAAETKQLDCLIRFLPDYVAGTAASLEKAKEYLGILQDYTK